MKRSLEWLYEVIWIKEMHKDVNEDNKLKFNTTVRINFTLKQTFQHQHVYKPEQS